VNGRHRTLDVSKDRIVSMTPGAEAFLQSSPPSSRSCLQWELGPVEATRWRKPFVPHSNLLRTAPYAKSRARGQLQRRQRRSGPTSTNAPDIVFSIMPSALVPTQARLHNTHHERTHSNPYRLAGLRVLRRRVLPQRALRKTRSHPHT
jgi:hypothetical protein